MKDLIPFLFLFQSVNAHSWAECVSYDPISFEYDSLGEYDRARCSGYPRGFERQFREGFGKDTGYNWPHNDCTRDPFKISDYTEQVPMAKYQPGQTIYISHPAKNHVADICTNQYIPSESLTVRMSSVSGADLFDIPLEMVGADHVNGQIDHLSYQRCYDFCSNKDKSHCLTGWVLPSNITEGVYSFIWSWTFNVGEVYSSCFDAYVNSSLSSSLNSSDEITFPPTIPTPAATLPSTTAPQIISSSAPALTGPLHDIVSYLMTIRGNLTFTFSQG